MKDTFNQDLEIGDFVVVAVPSTAFNPYVHLLGEVVAVFEDTCKIHPINRVYNKLMAIRSVSMQDQILKIPESLVPADCLQVFASVEE